MIQAEMSSSTPTVAWTLVLAGVLAIVAVSVAMLRRPRLVAVDPPALVPTKLPPTYVLHSAPQVKGMSLRDWLIHLHPREYRENEFGVWVAVVAEFVADLRGDQEVIDLFADRGTDMEKFQSHFLSALVILTHTGLTVGLLAHLQERHAGLGITGEMYDRTIGTLAAVLIRKGVTGETIKELGPAVVEIRGVIVEEAA